MNENAAFIRVCAILAIDIELNVDITMFTAPVTALSKNLIECTVCHVE